MKQARMGKAIHHFVFKKASASYHVPEWLLARQTWQVKMDSIILTCFRKLKWEIRMYVLPEGDPGQHSGFSSLCSFWIIILI